MAQDDVLNSRLQARDRRLKKDEDAPAERGPMDGPAEDEPKEVVMDEVAADRGSKRSEELQRRRDRPYACVTCITVIVGLKTFARVIVRITKTPQ